MKPRQSTFYFLQILTRKIWFRRCGRRWLINILKKGGCQAVKRPGWPVSVVSPFFAMLTGITLTGCHIARTMFAGNLSNENGPRAARQYHCLESLILGVSLGDLIDRKIDHFSAQINTIGLHFFYRLLHGKIQPKLFCFNQHANRPC